MLRKNTNFINWIIPLFALILLLLVKVPSGIGQERAITAKEMEDLKAKGYLMLRQMPHRENRLFEEYEGLNLSPTKVWRWNIEFVDLKTSREVCSGRFNNGKSRKETVYIQNKVFVKYDNDIWNEDLSAQPVAWGEGRNLESLYAREPNVISEFKYLGKETINNITADRYEITRKYFQQHKGREIFNLYKGNFWFDKTGRILKTEYGSNRLDGRHSYHEIRQFDYDPTIKIEAPIK